MSARTTIVPTTGALIGISNERATGQSIDDALTAHETLLGFRVNLPHYYHLWDTVQPTSDKITRAESGQIPLISWQGRRNNGSVVGWANIAAGLEDAWIDAQAARYGAVNGQFILSFENEPEDLAPANGTHTDYRAATQRIITRFRAAGALNVHWAFVVMGVMTTNKQSQVLAAYPGDSFIDWIGYDPYNWYVSRSNPWLSWPAMVEPWYTWAQTNLTSTRPYMLSEYGSEVDPLDPTRRQGWFGESATAIESGTFPNLKGLAYFDHPKPPASGEWTLGTGDDFTAYRAAMNRIRLAGQVGGGPLRSQLTSVRARTQFAARSLLTRVRGQTVATGRSLLTRVHARTVATGRSQLTGVRAQNLGSNGATAVLDGPALVDVGEVFLLSLANSSGGPFTGYSFTQTAGPTASVSVLGNVATVTAPAAKPNTAGWPNDAPLSMTFQGVVEKSGGAVTSSDTLTISLLPHTIWAADGSPLFVHFA